ncbi:FAD-binding oxidoreductase [Lysinibacillus telephonicus]|uniref:NAD(P)/FAD-dependent oxidoreductase n=1 Tax=Lysinibacillus telephonicus TaxID=1714840 RepID=UPI0016397173|nr:FAD-binding oxidoreductase [Lysinibacillus telephonicus]
MKQKVVVIGAGIIGTSVAYFLSKKNVNIVLVDAKDIASGTSGACDKAIMLQSKKWGPALELAIQSATLYKDLEQELQQDLEYRQGGGLILIDNEQDLKVLQQTVEKQNSIGLNVKILTGDEVRKKNPYLSEKIIAASWCEEDAEINPMLTAFAFAKAAHKNKAILRLNCEVLDLVTENNRILGVQTTHGKIYADSVVICSGVWTNQILKTVQLEVPIIPRKGIILVTEKLPKIIDCNILSGSYIVSKLQKEQNSIPYGIGLAISQTKSGTLLIGGSREFVGFDESIKTKIIRDIAKQAIHAFPCLDNIHLIRSFAGFRPYTPDNMPILGEIPSVQGLYIAAGHEGDGVALAPITGKLMSELITNQKIEFDLSPFSIERFLESTIS